MEYVFVHVSQIRLAHPLTVGLNAWLALNVLKAQLALVRNAGIHALDYVEEMLNAVLQITIQYVLV